MPPGEAEQPCPGLALRCGLRPHRQRPDGIQNVAIGFMGEPMPSRIRSGAAVNRNS